MKAAVVLLADYPVQNFVRRIAVDLNRNYQVDFFSSLLPPHISLKQPFLIEDLEDLDHYLNTLAKQIAPFEIFLDRIYHEEWEGYGILGLNVVETYSLRRLHNLLNKDLVRLFKKPAAPHDGDSYRFHLTIEMAKITTRDPFREYFERLPEKLVNMSFTARFMAMFYYAQETYLPGSFVTYKVLPLG